MKVTLLICALALLVAKSSALDDAINVNDLFPKAPEPDSLEDAFLNKIETSQDNPRTPVCIYRCRNAVDNVLGKFVENLRKYFQKHEPIAIGELPVHEVHDDHIQATIKATNVLVSKISTFQVNKLKNSLFQMTEEFKVTFPVLEIQGDYETSGTIEGAKEEGKGRFEATVTNVVAWGKVYAKLSRGKVYLKKINVDYTFSDLNTKVTGFKIEGKTDEEAQEILNEVLVDYLTTHEKYISGIVADVAVKEGNKVLNKMSLKELLQLLQHFKPKQVEE